MCIPLKSVEISLRFVPFLKTHESSVETSKLHWRQSKTLCFWSPDSTVFHLRNLGISVIINFPQNSLFGANYSYFQATLCCHWTQIVFGNSQIKSESLAKVKPNNCSKWLLGLLSSTIEGIKAIFNLFTLLFQFRRCFAFHSLHQCQKDLSWSEKN